MNDKPSKEVFITRWALTEGIVVAELPCDRYYAYGKYSVHKLGRDAFLSKAEAEERAKLMAKRRITSICKQLTKLNKLKGTPKWATPTSTSP